MINMMKTWQDEQQTEKEQRKAEMLDYVNALRAEFYAPPLTKLPKGITGSPRGCVIARSIEEGGTNVYASVTGEHIIMKGATYYSNPKTPDRVREFIAAFDGLQYPELIAA